MNRFLTLLLLGALASFALVGCDDDKKPGGGGNTPDASDDGDVPDAIVEVTTAKVFFVHAAQKVQTAVGALDLYVTAQDDEVLAGADPARADYNLDDVFSAELEAGDYSVHVFAAGDDPDTDEAALVYDFTVVAGADRTYAAVDQSGDESLPTVLLLDVIAPSDTAANSIVYAVHGAPDVGTVDVYTIEDEAADTLVVDDFAPSDQGPGLDLPVGTYRLGVETDDAQVTNDTNDDTYTVTFTAPVSSGGLEVYGIVLLSGGETPSILLYAQGGESVLTTLFPDDV
jgi:hypothetical protein